MLAHTTSECLPRTSPFDAAPSPLLLHIMLSLLLPATLRFLPRVLSISRELASDVPERSSCFSTLPPIHPPTHPPVHRPTHMEGRPIRLPPEVYLFTREEESDRCRYLTPALDARTHMASTTAFPVKQHPIYLRSTPMKIHFCGIYFGIAQAERSSHAC